MHLVRGKVGFGSLGGVRKVSEKCQVLAGVFCFHHRGTENTERAKDSRRGAERAEAKGFDAICGGTWFEFMVVFREKEKDIFLD
jgi:hypothetical protein